MAPLHEMLQGELLYGVLPPKCASLDTMLASPCLPFIISKLLGIAVIAGAFAVKLPQLLKIIRSGNVVGLSASSFYLEAVAYVPSVARPFLLGYALNTYGESVVVAAQAVLLVLVYWFYASADNKPSFMLRALMVTAYSAYAYYFLSGSMPEQYMDMLGIAPIPMFAASRIPQIFANFRNGHTGQLALITVLMTTAGTAARIFTTMQELDDNIILAGYLINGSLVLILLLQIIFYSKATAAHLAKVEGKKED